jgi:hypothetical protein
MMTLYQRWHRGDRDKRLVRPLRRYVTANRHLSDEDQLK